MTDHKDNIVEIEGVSFTYQDHEVLKDINLSIHRGDYIGLIGGNGSGKTTLLRIILGLEKPNKGLVKLFHTPLSLFNNWPKIGYVPQHVAHIDRHFPATVFEVVMMGRFGRRGLFKKMTDEDRDKVHLALGQVGLAGVYDRSIGELSGGQRQRVFIARALAGEPEIMFLDEPTIGVERGVKNEFYDLLRRLNKQINLTIVLVSHDIEDTEEGIQHIACLDEAHLYFHESKDAFIKKNHISIHA